MSANELAPGGRLRAALNLGNKLLVRRLEDGSPVGLTVDLARKLAERAGLDVDFQYFSKAGDVTDAVGTWDICFLAADPKRAAEIVFTPPYVTIEGHFLVAADCSARSSQDVDRLGLTIAAVRGSAYALHLLRNTPGERVQIHETAQEASAAFASGAAQVIVGLGSGAEARAKAEGLRVLQPPFMSIHQAIGVPAGRPAAARFVAESLDQFEAGGLLPAARTRHALVT